MDWFTSLPGIDELETAEEFLEFFGIAYDANQVRVNRLHIMHRFNLQLSKADLSHCYSEADRHLLAGKLLKDCYDKFDSHSLKENSTLSVYRRLDPSFVPFSALMEVTL